MKVLGIAGIVLNTYTYDAFGVITSQTATVENTFFYAGYQYDSETGLYYLRSRYYNAETARFITEDGFKGYYDDPLSLNRYTYCHNSPIIYFDPDGQAAQNTLMSDSGGSGLDKESWDKVISELRQKQKAEEKEKNFIQKVVEDVRNYKEYKTDLGGYYNEDPEKVYDANYFSNYKGSLVINIPWDSNGSAGFGPFIFMASSKNSTSYDYYEKTDDGSQKYAVSINNYEEILNHEYGHGIVTAEYGMLNSVLFNATPSLIGYNTETLPDIYTDETYIVDENGKERLDANVPYQNQPWESLANKYGGNSFSVRNGENDFYISEGVNTYIDKYKTLKQTSILTQLYYMYNKSKYAGLRYELLSWNGTEIWDNLNSLIWGK